ncbi:MAG: hypothetical protein CL779_00260 [Chloroflexi bacterium]|nr:hypothetical protein [Chloroflexota bacterium]|tara:strand:- start:1189 stop:1953 length:765 start_codon:yes stop_codon:yes gene_type:complete
MMSELNYISIDYKKNYAIVRYETNGDCWTEELLLEIKVACQKIQADQKCLSVLFMSDSKNSGFGWSKNFHLMTEECQAILNSALIAVEELPIPSFFLIQGITNLPAMEIALACDVRFSLDDTIISLIDKESNFQPSDFTFRRLAKFSHRSFALDLLLFKKSLNALDGKKSGIISEIYNSKGYLSAIEVVLEQITNYGAIAIKTLKDSMQLGEQVDLNTGLNIEHERTLQLQETDDFKEGIDAFLQKRPPKFLGK